jgi:hypothetical protein
MRAFQRIFVVSILDLVGEKIESLDVISVVPSRPFIAAGELTPEAFSDFRKTVFSAINTAKIHFGVGGIDVSFNEHKDRQFESHWKIHAWLITPKVLRDQARLLRSHFRSSQSTSRPIKIYAFDGNINAIAYALKHNFFMRTSLPAVTQPDGSLAPRNTRQRELRIKEKVELLIALDELGPSNRLLLHGIDNLVMIDNDVSTALRVWPTIRK